MPTGDAYVNIVLKRLLDYAHLKTNFFDYLRDLIQALTTFTFTKDGTFGDTKITIAASGADEFDLSSQIGTDGQGHFIEPGSTYEQNVKFENTNAEIYDIALHYAEVPEGVQVNPRTGLPEYQRFSETIGYADQPALVTNPSGSNVDIVLPDTMCDNDRTHYGRKAVAWKITPGPNGTTEVIAIQECTVYFSGGVNKITAADLLGDDVFDADETHYRVCLLGPIVTRQSEKPLVDEDGYWYIGEIEGDGAGNPPVNPNTTNQHLIYLSLSDMYDAIVALTQAFSDYSTKVMLSNWTERSSATTGSIESLFYGASFWVACGDSSGGSPEELQSSNLGDVWNAETSPVSKVLNEGLYDGTYYVCVGEDGATIHATDPEGSWTDNTQGTEDILCVGWDGASAYVCGQANGKVRTASDPTGTWTERDTPMSSGPWPINGVAQGSGKWVAVGDNGKLITASDPTGTWTENVDHPFYSAGKKIQAVIYDGTKWIATGEDGIIAVAIDPTATWTDKTSSNPATPADLRGVANIEGKAVVAVGLGGTIIHSFDHGDTWYKSASGQTANAYNCVGYDGLGCVCVGASDGKIYNSFRR